MIAPWIILAVAFIVASGFYSGSETGAYCINRIRLRLRADTGDRRAVMLRRLLADEQSSSSVRCCRRTCTSDMPTALCEARRGPWLEVTSYVGHWV